MTLAWLCYEHSNNFDCGYNPSRAIILFTQPNNWSNKYAKIVPIVYAEIKK